MGKWCLRASLFIFDWIIIKVAGNQDRHKSSVEFDFEPNQTTHFGVTCPWVMKIPHFWTWISLKPVGQSWSNFMCSIIGVGERLHKVLGQIDLGTLDSGERSLPFGLLVNEIMVVFVLHKLILQTCMHSHPMGLDVWLLVGPLVYFHTSCVRTAKALVRLRGCTGSPEPSLVAYVISTIISWAGSNFNSIPGFGHDPC